MESTGLEDCSPLAAPPTWFIWGAMWGLHVPRDVLRHVQTGVSIKHCDYLSENSLKPSLEIEKY